MVEGDVSRARRRSKIRLRKKKELKEGLYGEEDLSEKIACV